MAETKGAAGRYFLLICISAVMFWNHTSGSVKDGFLADYSNMSLQAVPKKIPAQITTLDLSYNGIAELNLSDFSSFSQLQRLVMHHNKVANLDLSVFKYNRELEYLDLSHNSLETISCYPMTNLKHLNLSCSRLVTMPMCYNLLQMPKLEFLSFGLKTNHSVDISLLADLRLDTLCLDLEELSENFIGNLVLNPRNLEMVLPKSARVLVFPSLVLNQTENAVFSKIENHNLIPFFSKLNRNGNLLTLTLNNLKLPWSNLIYVLQKVWEASIRNFSIYNVHVTSFDDIFRKLNYVNTPLRTLTFKNVTLGDVEFSQPYVYGTLANMNIPTLTVSNAGMVHMVCPSQSRSFTYLDFSNNALTDALFEQCGNLMHVESLILKSNAFKRLIKVSLMTRTMRSLKYLDMSDNFLHYEDNGKDCQWGENIEVLNLSFNVLSQSVFRCLPVNIRKLYLQNNKISEIPQKVIELNYLEELNLASNKLIELPSCIHFGRLRSLNIERNSIRSVSHNSLQSCRSIKVLNGASNPFMCSCELRLFINEGRQGHVKMVDWPDSYTCEYPANLRGTLLKDFHISELACNVTLLIIVALIVTVVFMAVVSFLCIHFDVLWYLKMMWHWTRAKHRIWKTKPQGLLDNIHFHAFVSYSERDSDWVKNVLIQNLEKEDGSIRICQHERNFIAGKSIVENIIDCIEKSYKSIFVLSPNFVQSEWCHYELYFAHHKLFSENADGLILVLLDTIPPYIIPSKYHMLKSLMARRTYLEWPKEKSKQGFFWANLRAAIQITLPNNVEMNEVRVLTPDIQDDCLL